MEEGSASDSHSQWSKLCSDILLYICQHHVEPQLQIDFRRRVRAVCALWRSSVPLPLTRLRFPLKVPSFNDDTSSVLLLETTYYVMSPPLPTSNSAEDTLNLNADPPEPKPKPKGWLIHVTEIKPNTWRLLRPMSSIGNLFHSNPPIRCEINNLLDYEIREVMQTYDLVGDGTNRLCRDVVVSLSDPEDNDNDCILTVLLIDMQGQLLIWKLGDTKWTKLRIQAVDSSCYPPTYDVVSWPGASNYWYFAPFPHGDNCTPTKWLHIATHKGKFYIVDCTSGKVCVIEPPMLAATSDPMIFKPTIIMPPPLEPQEDDSCGLPWYRFLVECKGQLYYVIDEWPCTFTKSVRDRGTITFVLKEGEDNRCWWECVDDSMELEDQVFFILNGPPFSVPTSDLGFGSHSGGGWACYASRNPDCCIATSSTKGLEALDRLAYPLYFTCLYKCQLIRLKSQSHRTCIHFLGLSDDEYSSIFFPPPPWLNWHCPANGNARVSFMDLPFKERHPFRRPPRSRGPAYRVFDSANEIDNIQNLESETY